jgi:succinylarginine dihydrolase
VHDVGVVGVVAAIGGRVQPGDRGVDLVVVGADGVVEGEGEVQGKFCVRQARRADVRAQDLGAVVDVRVVVAPGIA